MSESETWDASKREAVLSEMMGRPSMIVAIDGPAGAGKSSVSQEVARRLGMLYLDTGSMYRMVAYLRIAENIDDQDQDGLLQVLKSADISIRQGQNGTAIFLNGLDISGALRTPQISNEASRISAWTSIRQFLVPLQRKLCQTGRFVVEGRDIGTVVFPETPYKFYLDASLDERARRRHSQLIEMGQTRDINTLREEIRLRDYNDSHRLDSPLTVSPDACFIDTTEMSQETVILHLVDSVQTIFEKSKTSEKRFENSGTAC